MGSRRFVLASLCAMLVLGAFATPTLSKKPDPATGPGERPLTTQEQSASDRKAAEAERYVAARQASDEDLVPLGCITPTGTDTRSLEASSVTAESEDAVSGGGDPTALSGSGCWVPQGFLAVEARDQLIWSYCAPAVAQVIANYSWAMPAGANKFTQQRLAGWMSTDQNGGTGAFQLEYGLELATRGSPRRPANWDWIVTPLTDTDRDGWVGDQLDAYVRSNVSGSRMPLAIPVKPHDPNSPSGAYLLSWPRPVQSAGHWVAIYGWLYVHDGSDRARLYYTDSSKDEGGGTGKYWTPTRWFTLMILEHTGRLVW